MDSLLKYKPSFSVKTINDTLLITGIYNQTLTKKDRIQLGDIIVKVENKSISDALTEKVGSLMSVSNQAYLKYYNTYLLCHPTDSINIDIISKNGIHKNKYIHLYQDFKEESPAYLNVPKKENYLFIQPEIGYVNLGKISKEELGLAFTQMTNTKAMIIDLRNYPKISSFDLAKYLYPKKKVYRKILFPLKDNPSYGEYDGKIPLNFIGNPFSAGKNNPNYYKGKVILLVNRKTGSHAEDIGMAIQQAPNCITIGEQTMGAVMNPIGFTLSDKDEINFTGLGAFYPNGEVVQGKGLHIDHYVNENAKNYDPDQYIKSAIKLILQP